MIPPPSAPVDLVRPGLDVATGDGRLDTWLIAGGLALVSVVLIATLLRVAKSKDAGMTRVWQALPRVPLGPSAEWRAFHDLAARLGLAHRHRAALSRLGRLTDAPPVALVLSEHALDTALARLDLRAVSERIRPSERVIAEARRLAFADAAAGVAP
ncbi:MAG: hypothetical protein KDA21_12705 [Phycisphaerales bacterium]|nr:hypothetical protein [Phycisphaerales bacterium]